MNRLPSVIARVSAIGLCVLLASPPSDSERGPARTAEPFAATFSIVGIDLATGDVGVVVQSKFPNVRPIIPWAEAGVGAIATQSYINVSYGPRGLALLRNGASAEDALRILLPDDPKRDLRQVGIIDAQGNAARWTGGSASTGPGASRAPTAEGRAS